MMNVTIAANDMSGKYNWGIKNYALNLVKNMDKDVKIVIVEKKMSGIMDYIRYPKFVKKSLPPGGILHLASQTFGYFSRFGMKNRTIATCHDLMAFSNPEFFENRKYAAFSRLMIRGVEKCEKIIAVSEFTKHQLVKYLGVDGGKIYVIHSGISEDFWPRKKKNDTDYIVYFGSEEKRKNVAAFIEAFCMLKKEYPEIKLVKNYNNPFIWKKILSMGLERDVIVTGNLTQKQMAEYYSSAKAFVYPSLFEGFGFAPLEAMACGCPVAASDAAAVPEILGDAPLYFNPLDASEICNKVSMILESRKLSRKMSAKSVKHAKKFTWKKTSKKTKKVYEEVAV
ncbi:MAG: glycosyltransferase family 4 protein [Candidatus Aenigmarchaeota archaeon]|nr:glycosyltransferase family 4 protein [Candidatus Aenigmarchaeota archaeon]